MDGVTERLGDVASRALSRDQAVPARRVLAGGDDHALVATFPPGATPPQGWTVVGEVVEGEGVLVDGRVWEGSGGHRHF